MRMYPRVPELGVGREREWQNMHVVSWEGMRVSAAWRRRASVWSMEEQSVGRGGIDRYAQNMMMFNENTC